MRRASWRVIRSAVSRLRLRPPSVQNSGVLFFAGEAGRRHVGIEIVLKQVMRWSEADCGAL